jgi:hypothetical protein
VIAGDPALRDRKTPRQVRQLAPFLMMNQTASQISIGQAVNQLEMVTNEFLRKPINSVPFLPAHRSTVAPNAKPSPTNISFVFLLLVVST